MPKPPLVALLNIKAIPYRGCIYLPLLGSLTPYSVCVCLQATLPWATPCLAMC